MQYEKLLFVFAVVAAACTLISCDKSSKELVIDYLPFQSEKDGGWGLLGKDGKPLFKDKFDDKILWAVNGVFAVETKDGISLYRTSENPKLIPGCEDLCEVGMMNEGLIPIVRKGKRIEYVDKNGKTKFVLNPYKGKEIVSAGTFFDGLALITTEEHKYGFINTKGQITIEPKYRYATSFYKGLCIVSKREDGNCWNDIIIDKTGKEIKRFDDYSIQSILSDGTLLADIIKNGNRRWALFDAKGEIIQKLPKEVEEVVESKGDYYIYTKGYGEVGVNNMKNETVIRAKYEEIHFVGNNKFLALKNDKWRLIDNDGNTIKAFDEEEYREVAYFEDWDCLIGFIDYHEAELLNTKGEKISDGTFYGSFDYSLTRILSDKYYPQYIRSDYLDIDATAENIANAISEDGVDNIKIGDSIRGGYLNDHFTFYNEAYKIYTPNNTSLYLYGGSKKTIKSNSFLEDIEASDAKVDLLVLDLSLDITDNIKATESLVNIVRDKMVAKGFKVTKQGKLACELQKGDKTLCIYLSVKRTYGEETSFLSMVLMPTSDRNTALMFTSDRSTALLKPLEELEMDYRSWKNNPHENKWEKGLFESTMLIDANTGKVIGNI